MTIQKRIISIIFNYLVLSTKNILVTASLLFAANAATFAASSDDYLSLIEAEARGVIVSSTSSADSLSSNELDPATLQNTTPADKKHIKPGMNQRGFEQDLKMRFAAIYKRYGRLKKSEKKKVYEAYTIDNTIKRTRKIILKLKLDSLASGRR